MSLSAASSLALVDLLAMPALIGVLATFILLLAQRSFWSRRKIKIIAAYIVIPIILVVILETVQLAAGLFIFIAGVVVAVTWQTAQWRGVRRAIALLIALCLLFCAIDVIPFINPSKIPSDVQRVFQIAAFVWPIVAVVIASQWVQHIITEDKQRNWWLIGLQLAFVVLLLGSILYQAIIGLAWDDMTDGLFGMMAITSASFAGIAAAMLLAWSLSNEQRWIAQAFLLCVIGAMQIIAIPAIHISPATLTQQHAEEVNQAVLRYHTQNGRYPTTLDELLPFYLWHIPQPIMVRDLTWCYAVGTDYYRLGYVFRPGYNTPASVCIHATAGNVPNSTWLCTEDAARINLQGHFQ
jgi:hypothetical protein